MRAFDNGSFYSVTVTRAEIENFAAQWPCSGMRSPRRALTFQFDKRNGDLVDIIGEPEPAGEVYDGPAMVALSEDAQKFGRYLAECANCGGPLPTGHGCHSKDGKHRFCDHCAGYSDALGIGARSPAMLYDDGKGHATSWTGAVMGDIVHKHAPEEYRQFGSGRGPFLTRRGGMRGAVRYRVRMLDGSLWHGSGPTDNGTYIRLRPMAGQ